MKRYIVTESELGDLADSAHFLEDRANRIAVIQGCRKRPVPDWATHFACKPPELTEEGFQNMADMFEVHFQEIPK